MTLPKIEIYFSWIFFLNKISIFLVWCGVRCQMSRNMHGEKRPGTGTFLSFVVCVCVCKCVCVCVKGGGWSKMRCWCLQYLVNVNWPRKWNITRNMIYKITRGRQLYIYVLTFGKGLRMQSSTKIQFGQSEFTPMKSSKVTYLAPESMQTPTVQNWPNFAWDATRKPLSNTVTCTEISLAFRSGSRYRVLNFWWPKNIKFYN
jgi:hypothetical protein